ncbi:hypothetical protein Tco_0200388 [Tanacetum coccineum]
MAESILYDNMEKALTESNLSITSNDINIELSKEFLVELRKNIYHGTYNEDVVDHIAKNGGLVKEIEKSPLGRNLLRNTFVDSIPNHMIGKMKFELKKILIDKMDKSESYLAAPEPRQCYEGLIKSYDLDKTIFSTYGKVCSLKRSRKDKDKDEDPSAGSDRGLKKRKTSKDAALATSPKAKESHSGSSKGDKSQSKSSGKSVQSVEPEFEVADSDMPQDQEENPGNNDEETKEKVASKHDWFTNPTKP